MERAGMPAEMYAPSPPPFCPFFPPSVSLMQEKDALMERMGTLPLRSPPSFARKGAPLFPQLLDSPTVMHVYAFNWPSRSATSVTIQLSAFEKRGLNNVDGGYMEKYMEFHTHAATNGLCDMTTHILIIFAITLPLPRPLHLFF